MPAKKKVRKVTKPAVNKEVAGPSPTSFQIAVRRVEEAQAAVDTSRATVDAFKKQVEDLEWELREVTRNLLDAGGYLSAQECKLRREMEALRSVTYQTTDGNWNCGKASLSEAQCEKAPRNY